MRAFPLPMLCLLAASLVACSNSGRHDIVISYLNIHDGMVAVHAPGRADADISATGDLRIAGTAIAVTPAQRELLQRYYTTALALRNHGIATGNAGIATAGKAIDSVATGLFSGNPGKIASEVDASAAKVEAQANLVCSDLARLQSTQQALAAQLPAFQPYALIEDHEAIDCQRGLRNHERI